MGLSRVERGENKQILSGICVVFTVSCTKKKKRFDRKPKGLVFLMHDELVKNTD